MSMIHSSCNQENTWDQQNNPKPTSGFCGRDDESDINKGAKEGTGGQNNTQSGHLEHSIRETEQTKNEYLVLWLIISLPFIFDRLGFGFAFCSHLFSSFLSFFLGLCFFRFSAAKNRSAM